MAKKIKFALKMKDGIEVRTLKGFRAAFALEQALAYFLDGKLLVWLEDRFYDEEAAKVSALENTDPELPRKLCDIFGVEYREGMLDKKEEEEVDSSFEDESLAQNDEAKGISYIRKLTDSEFNVVKCEFLSLFKKQMSSMKVDTNVPTCDNEERIACARRIASLYIMDKYRKCPEYYRNIAQNVATNYIATKITIGCGKCGPLGYELLCRTGRNKKDLEEIHGKIAIAIIMKEFVNGNIVSVILDGLYTSSSCENKDLAIELIIGYFKKRNLDLSTYQAELKNQVSCLFEQISNSLIKSI